MRLRDGSSGWVKPAYLTTQEPATARLKQLQEEQDRSRATTPALAEAAARSELELLKRELDKGRYHEYAGAGMVLTGGTSALRGIQHVAEEIFQMPVQLCQAQNVVGVTSAFENPQYSTAIGLVKYAQATLDDQRGGWFDWFKRWFR